MDKGYKLLSHREPLTISEIKSLYDGYWVYIVNAKFGEARKLLSGVPVVAGTRVYAGAKDGIYEKYNSPEYGEQVELILFKPDGFMASLIITETANA